LVLCTNKINYLAHKFGESTDKLTFWVQRKLKFMVATQEHLN